MPKPLEINQILNATGDPATGQKNVWQAQLSQKELSDLGALVQSQENLSFPQHCGCFKPPGGLCHEGNCRRTSCVDCHGVCSGSDCQKPICPEHSFYLELPGRPKMRLCRSCYGKTLRRHRTFMVVKTVLSPFVRFEK